MFYIDQLLDLCLSKHIKISVAESCTSGLVASILSSKSGSSSYFNGGIIAYNNDIKIKMTLTNPNCPVAGTMPESVGKSVEKIENIKSIEVSLVWEPKWHKDLMSEEAKLALDIF